MNYFDIDLKQRSAFDTVDSVKAELENFSTLCTNATVYRRWQHDVNEPYGIPKNPLKI